jgi:hypothetical protein
MGMEAGNEGTCEFWSPHAGEQNVGKGPLKCVNDGKMKTGMELVYLIVITQKVDETN